MKITTALLSSALLASTALAAPLTEERRAAKQARSRKSNPPFAVGTTEAIKSTGIKNVDYSSNWAGAVLIGTGYTSVTATFTVPTPKEPSGGSSSTQYCASAWVGLDGDTCDNAILQTGVDFCVQGSSVSYDAWYEWYPDYAYDFSGISFSAGDSVTITVTASSLTGGTAVITNNSKDKTVSHTFSGQPSLCEYNAEWIVEDFEEGSSLVPFANFGTVTFSGASATHSGSSVGPSGADIIDIEQNNKVLTSVSTTSSSVTVSYV